MMRCVLTIALIFNFGVLLAQNKPKDIIEDSVKFIYRDYQFIIAPDYDLYNSSVNTRTAGKLVHDVFTKGIGPKIKNKTVRNISEGIWSFATTYSSMIWSHEFGHMLRAKQVGGNFTIEKFSFPVIYGDMDLPPNHTFEENALSVAGGFEVNYLTVRDIQLDLYRHNSLYNDELGLSFAHRMLFPIYFSIIAPINPEQPNTWINTMGDPIHWVKPVWERSGNEVIQSDGSVNPKLVRFYKYATLSSLLWNFADLNFYREVSALFGNSLDGKEAKYLVGNNESGWGYGTHFNTSVLGAELYLINYLQLSEQLYTFNFRYGFPFKSIGIGVGVYDIFSAESKFNMDLYVDVWDQEYYNIGFALTTNATYKLDDHFEFLLQTGYKTKGYLIGRKIEQGLIGNFGLSYVLQK